MMLLSLPKFWLPGQVRSSRPFGADGPDSTLYMYFNRVSMDLPAFLQMPDWECRLSIQGMKGFWG